MVAKVILIHLPSAQRARFWRLVTPGHGLCRPWLSGCNKHTGYGMFEVMRDGVKRRWAAHRVAYALTKGEPPPDLLVLHACDNRPCCNPEHLYLGTHADNSRDMMERGRYRAATIKPFLGVKGAAHPAAHPDHAGLKARAIVLYQERHTMLAIATQLGVHRQTISRWWDEHVVTVQLRAPKPISHEPKRRRAYPKRVV